MFCENCGTRVDDGQPFCPNCGSKMPVPEAPAAPANPAPEASVNAGYVPPVAPAAKTLPSFGGLLDKFNALQGLEKIYYGCTFGLLILCFILSLLKVFGVSFYGASTNFSLASGAPWLLVLSTILFTLCITFFLLDYFDKFTFKFLWYFIAGAAALIFVLFVIKWISGVEGYSVHLSVGGWFFLIFQAGLTAVSILYLLERKKH